MALTKKSFGYVASGGGGSADERVVFLRTITCSASGTLILEQLDEAGGTPITTFTVTMGVGDEASFDPPLVFRHLQVEGSSTGNFLLLVK